LLPPRAAALGPAALRSRWRGSGRAWQRAGRRRRAGSCRVGRHLRARRRRPGNAIRRPSGFDQIALCVTVHLFDGLRSVQCRPRQASRRPNLSLVHRFATQHGIKDVVLTMRCRPCSHEPCWVDSHVNQRPQRAITRVALLYSKFALICFDAPRVIARCGRGAEDCCPMMRSSLLSSRISPFPLVIRRDSCGSISRQPMCE